MLYREQKRAPLRRLLLLLVVAFDPVARRRRRTEQDILSLSPYLQRDIGWAEGSSSPAYGGGVLPDQSDALPVRGRDQQSSR